MAGTIGGDSVVKNVLALPRSALARVAVLATGTTGRRLLAARYTCLHRYCMTFIPIARDTSVAMAYPEGRVGLKYSFAVAAA